MRKQFAFFLLFAIKITVNGQDIIRDEVRVSGLYQNFTSFRTNNPDIEGDISFLRKENGTVKSILINGDSLKNKEIIKKYWGFCKDDTVYYNVFSSWDKLGTERIPLSAYAPIFEWGRYFITAVNTIDSSSPIMVGALAGGMIGGIIGGLITMAEMDGKEEVDGMESALNDPTNRIIVINHQTGQPKIADKNALPFLIGNDAELLKMMEKDIEENKIRSNEELAFVYRYLRTYNERNSKTIKFDERIFWTEITVVKKTKRQASDSVQIYIDDHLLGEVSAQEYLKTKIRPGQSTLTFKTSYKNLAISDSITVSLKEKERRYFIISHPLKSSDLLQINESDFTRTKYAIQALDK